LRGVEHGELSAIFRLAKDAIACYDAFALCFWRMILRRLLVKERKEMPMPLEEYEDEDEDFWDMIKAQYTIEFGVVFIPLPVVDSGWSDADQATTGFWRWRRAISRSWGS